MSPPDSDHPATAIAPTHRHRLDNGLTVLVRENHAAPVATADIWVGTGSAGETPEVNGISHFLEHMLFKGTENFGLGQIEREIENVGGVCNAGTSYDFTHYYITLPSESIERGVQMLAEMVRGSVLDAGELEKERLVILEEYRRKQDDPGAMLHEDLYEYLHETGPYHRSVIGEEATIRSITRDQMFDYFRRHYAPENMALVVAGDVTAEQATELAGRYLGDFDRPYEPLLTETAPTRFAEATRRHRDKSTGGEEYFGLAMGVPHATDLDTIIALELAETILAQGRASILYQEIKEKRRLASTIGGYYALHRHASCFIVSATAKPEKIGELRGAVEETIDRFAREPIAEEQMNRARRMLASSQLFSLETAGGAAVQTGYYYTLLGGLELLDEFVERIQKTTADQVRRALLAALEAHRWNEVTVGPELGNGSEG